MEGYYQPITSTASSPCLNGPDDGDDIDDFDCHRQRLVNQAVRSEGWRAELARYLTDVPEGVSKDTDIVGWWAVCTLNHVQ
jgi:hypothetical protein